MLTLEPDAVEALGAESIDVVGVGRADGETGDFAVGKFAFDAIGSQGHGGS